MKNLILMTDFVLEQYELSRNPTIFEERAFKYASFLKQPLELWMFVPCDEEGNVLKQCSEICACECNKIILFREAKKRCLFEVANLDLARILLQEYENIEELSNDIVKVKITEIAKNMFK